MMIASRQKPKSVDFAFSGGLKGSEGELLYSHSSLLLFFFVWRGRVAVICGCVLIVDSAGCAYAQFGEDCGITCGVSVPQGRMYAWIMVIMGAYIVVSDRKVSMPVDVDGRWPEYSILVRRPIITTASSTAQPTPSDRPFFFFFTPTSHFHLIMGFLTTVAFTF